ncbi:DNA polymerase-3 subunit epsilon [Nonlabens dokdonensis]|uniref:DNA polymerase III, epsilon subunit n=2 Tax=Nonlabens dokdonensis TaxID=328515 RepID=L7WDY2_NONDD|nr:exonuclease domain-containing protein [Nonlabens dokdonensis]AGC78151.1 DNA polymerase III, epsilon subunit [Nonlabens dokdonensis DSW-6]PZX37955.1 DNA polymerase-3 subunit epsilon [Nonlabens dokdonensis]
MYAIVDVETTGGKYNEEGITEIAIYKFDGHEIVDQFASLVNPEKEIQPFVVKLTGINNAMLKRAPKFYEVAKRIIEITNDVTLVAHNAEFDHRMLRLEFERLGYDYQKPTLCTVELAQTLLPDQESFNLGKLTKALGIPITDRHRATGDALATVKLFKLLLQKDIDKNIISKSLKHHKPLKLQSNLKELLDDVPNSTGVFYIYNKNNEIIYISKSKNIKRRVTQLFTGSNGKSKAIQKQVSEVKYEKTGSQLISILKEYIEVRKHKPFLNGKPKKSNFSHGLYISKDQNENQQLNIKSVKSNPDYSISFSSYRSGLTFIEKQLEDIDIADAGKATDILIEKIENLYTLKNKSKIIVDRGREASERSVILIVNGKVLGYAYVNLRIQMTDVKMLKSLLTPLESSDQITHIISSYLIYKRVYQVIDL